MANPSNKSSEAPKYINGVFVTRKEGKYGEFFSVGLNDDGLKALAGLEKSDSGFRNFILTPQKADPNKFSARPSTAKGKDILPF